MNFYRRFLPGIARILLPLTASLANNAKPFLWSNSMEEAFTLAKAALSQATTLTHPDPTAQSPWPLTPPTPTLAQFSGNLNETPGDLWPSSAGNFRARKLGIPLLTENCLQYMPPYAISVSSWEVVRSSFLPTIRLFAPPYTEFPHPGRPTNRVIFFTWQNSLAT